MESKKEDGLADVGMYLGIESREEGYVVVSVRKSEEGLIKKDEYVAGDSKGKALESFKLASGKFIVDFNTKAKPVKKG